MNTPGEAVLGASSRDFVTIATAADGKLMTKIFYVDGEGREQTRSYDKGYLFNVATPVIGCLDDLARVLNGLDRHSCVIYGRLIEGTITPCRRLLNADPKTGDPATIEDAAHFWLLLDIDKLATEGEVFDPVAEPERAVEYILARLPSEFHGARCLWRLTSSAGVEKRATISMRLGFWLERALTGAEAKAWLTGTIADCSIYTANQVIYAATPIFKDGRTDPVAKRSGIVEGAAVVVPPPIKITSRVVGVPAGREPKARVAPRCAPEGVIYDTETAIAAGRDCIERALASDEWQRGTPTPTGARAYKLAARLKDEALSPQCIVDLLIELVPWFDEEERPLIREMVESVFRHGQNGPGCGPPDNTMRLFDEISDIDENEGEKLRTGTKAPKWSADPRSESDDQTPPIDIFGDVTLTGRPVFPVDVLPFALNDFVIDRAERMGVDPAMIAMPALAACAAALDDRHVVQVRKLDAEWVESARLWIMIVEDPGGKKTPAISAALGPLREIENAWHVEDQPKQAMYELSLDTYREDRRKYTKAGDQGRLEALFSGSLTEPEKPPLRRLVITDTTTEALAKVLSDNPAGLLGHFDELAHLLGSFDTYRGKASGRDRAMWLQLYNGGQLPIDRASSGNLRVPNWSVSIVGGIQPERLRKLSPDLSDDGFLQRFIPVFGGGASRGIDRPADEEAVRRYRGLLESILARHTEPPIRVTLSDEAHETRERVMERVEALLTLPDTPAPLKNFLNKCEALFARLVLTMHAVEYASWGFPLSTVIQGFTAQRVERLMLEYLLPNALRCYREFYGRDEHAEHACWVADYILSHGLSVITRREVYRAYSALRDNEQALYRAMFHLEVAGWIVPVNAEKGTRTTRWWVDPRVHQLFAERAAKEKVRRAQEVKKISEAAKKLGRAA